MRVWLLVCVHCCCCLPALPSHSFAWLACARSVAAQSEKNWEMVKALKQGKEDLARYKSLQQKFKKQLQKEIETWDKDMKKAREELFKKKEKLAPFTFARDRLAFEIASVPPLLGPVVDGVTQEFHASRVKVEKAAALALSAGLGAAAMIRKT